ncbi:MAG: DUF4298 domain-containing protein [Treponema sp.]|nr:DUF4298 domain-containing protein [Treponema sp.]
MNKPDASDKGQIKKSISRIRKMEKILDNLNALMSSLENDLNSKVNVKRFLAYQKKVIRLENYYSGPEWKKDFELDEQGAFPPSLKRGVLSEDGIYDALEKNKELMAKIA